AKAKETKKAAKPAPKPVAAKPVAAKPVASKPAAKPAAKPAPAPQPKAEAAPAPPPPLPKKPSPNDPQSLATIKPAPKPIIKKEPAKPTKVVIPKTSIKSAVKYEPEFTKSVLDSYSNEQTGPTMRYSDSDLAEFREIINKKLDAAKKELAYLQGLITRR